MALAFRQTVTGSSTTTSPAVSTAFASNPTVGQLIVLTTSDDSGGSTSISGVTDTGSNTWHNLFYTGATASIGAWYTIITGTGATFKISVAWDVGTTAAVSFAAQEFSGFVGTPTVDILSTAQGATSTAPSSLAVSSAQAAELIIGSANHSGAVSAFTLGTGYTNLGTVSLANAAVAQESKVVATTGSQTATFTIAASRAWACNIVSFYDFVAANSLMTGLSSITGINTVTF